MVSQVLRAILGSALRVVLVLLLLVTLLPAVSMVRTAAAKTKGADNTNASVNTNAAAETEGSDADADASASAETEAQTKELGTAVGSFWTLAWERSWPFIKGVALKFWTTLATIFKGVRGSVEVDSNANVSGVNLVNVNGSIEVQ